MRQRGLYTVNVGNYVEKSEPVSWTQVAGANFGYKYAPLADTITESMLFGNLTRDENFDFLEAIKGYEPYAKELVRAKNDDHFNFLLSSVMRNVERRETLSKASFFQGLTTELIDPLNMAFALPVMGKLGLLTRPGMSVGQAAYISSKAGLAAGVASETIRAPFDPLSTTSEVALNVGASTVFGGLLGGAFAGVLNLTRGGFHRAKRSETDFDRVTFDDNYLDDVIDDVPVNYKATIKGENPSVYYDGKRVVVDQERVMDEFYFYPWTRPEVEFDKALGELEIDSKQQYHDFLVHRAVIRKNGWNDNLIQTDTRLTKFKNVINDSQEIIADIESKPRQSSKQLAYVDFLKKRIEEQKVKAKGSWYTQTSREALDKVVSNYSYRSTANAVFKNGFPNSALFRAVSTPVNDVLFSKATDASKRDMLLLSGSSSLPVERNTQGYGQTSLVNRLNFHVATANRHIGKLEDIYAQYELGQSEAKRFFGQSFTGNDFDEFHEQMVLLRARLETTPDLYNTLPDEFKAFISEMDQLYDGALNEAQDVGLLSSVKNVRKRISDLKEKIDELDAEMEATTDEAILQPLAESRKNAVMEIDFLEGLPTRQQNKHYFPRNYMAKEIEADPAMYEDFVGMWMNVFDRKPVKKIWDDEKQAYVPNNMSRKQFAQMVVERILQEEPFLPYTTRPEGTPLSRYFFQRVADDVDESEVMRFIYKDSSVTQMYMQKIGRAIEWRKTVGNRTLEEKLAEIDIRERKNGLDDKEIAKIKKAYVIDFDRIMGRFIEDPARFDNRIAQLGKGFAQVAYLGKASYAALGDTHSIIGQRGLSKTFSPFFKDMEREVMRMNRADLKKITESLGVGQVSSFNRLVADNTQLRTAFREEKLMNKALKLYHTLPFGSFLHPVTRMFRGWHGGLVSSEFIEKSIKVTEALSGQRKMTRSIRLDLEDLARYGIDKDTAADIANYSDFWQKPEGSSLYYANVTNWPMETARQRAVLRKFKDALEANISNTVIFAQLADKPAFVDGAFYVPYKPWMRNMGFEPDPRITTGGVQYAKVGSGLFGWPFVFWSYSLAALPRVMGRLADPMREHRLTQVMSAIALGGLVVMTRNLTNPNYFKYTEGPDLVHRAIEYSGITSIYGDIFTMGLHMALNSGMIDREDSILKGKYPGKPIDAVTELGGAPVGVIQGFIEGGNALLNGDTREGIAEISRSMPKANLLAWQLDMEDLYSVLVGYDD